MDQELFEHTLDQPPIAQSSQEISAAKEWKIVSVRQAPAPEELLIVRTPLEATHYWQQIIASTEFHDPERESAVVLYLNVRLRVRGHQIISTGSLDHTVVHPREVFKAAILANAHSIILMHNHPSGEVDPSPGDRRMTQQLQEAGALLRIELRDHIIVGHDRFYSFREEGLL